MEKKSERREWKLKHGTTKAATAAAAAKAATTAHFEAYWNKNQLNTA